MSAIDISTFKTLDLLRLFAGILDELRTRGVVRSSNNPVSDYTEGLVAAALSLTLVTGSTTGYDAEDKEGNRYEIKGRRWTRHNRSTQLSVVRGLELKHFNFLAGVLYNEDFSVERACLIPHTVVSAVATHRKHVNGWIIHLQQSLWGKVGVRDITDCVRKTQETFGA